MKSWNYAEITAQAEKKIKSLASNAEKASGAAKEIRLKWAYGVYLGWYDLTCGWQNPGDCDRMQALAEGKAQDQ